MDQPPWMLNKPTEIGLTPATKRLWKTYQNNRPERHDHPDMQPPDVKIPDPNPPPQQLEFKLVIVATRE